MDHAFRNHLKDELFYPMVKTIDECFGMEFMNKSDNHPLQNIWRRSDFIAATELYFFSECLSRLKSGDETWTKAMVEKLKSSDRNNFRGNVFEVIALGILAHDDNKVFPSKENNPGIDGVIELNNEKRIRFSLKNFNLSTYQELFNKKSKEFESKIIEAARERKKSKFMLFISCTKEKIRDDDWELLFAHIPVIMDNLPSEESTLVLEEIWEIKIGMISADNGYDISELVLSYTLTMCAPFHPNERDNLISRIDAGIENLIKHAQNEDHLNFLFIQLPVTASFNKTIEWAGEYIMDKVEKPISAIMCYQPFFYLDDEKREFYLINPLKFVTKSESYKKLGLEKNPFPVSFPTGKVISDPPEKKYGDSAHRISPEDELYIYQSGSHNYVAKIVDKDESGITFKIKMDMPDFGIMRNNIIEVNSEIGVHLESIFYPPGDKLHLI